MTTISRSLHEMKALQEKLDRMRHVFRNDANGGIVSHNILSAWLIRWESPPVIADKFGLTEDAVINTINDAILAIENAWHTAFGDAIPVISRKVSELPSKGEMALERYLEDACKSK